MIFTCAGERWRKKINSFGLQFCFLGQAVQVGNAVYDDKPGEVVNETIAGHGVFQILFFKVLGAAQGTSRLPGKPG